MPIRASFVLLALLLSVQFASVSQAMPAPVQVRPGKISRPMQSGAVIGGQASEEFSLIGVKTALLSHHGERIVLNYGDRAGNPQKGEPGYFHVELDNDARRVVIDLAQVHKTTIDSVALARILKTSKLVASSEMTMDPADGSTNITINMKVPVRIKAGTEDRESNSDQAKVVVEFEPAGAIGTD